jgi:esterase
MLNTIIHGEPTAKPPLLIAHGLFGSGRNWGVIAKRLSDERQVIAVDMRNHGSSFWHDSHAYEDLADDLAGVIPERADVLGHSMGGKSAMMLALRHPEKVGRLIVADIAPVSYGHSQQQNIDAMRRVDLSRVTNRAEAAAQLQGLEPGLSDFFMQSLDMKEKRWKLNFDALEGNMGSILSFPEVIGRFDGPVLFLTGALSNYVLPEHRDRIKTLFPKARFAKIPGAGHWLHAEKPREFEAAVRTFLNL